MAFNFSFHDFIKFDFSHTNTLILDMLACEQLIKAGYVSRRVTPLQSVQHEWFPQFVEDIG